MATSEEEVKECFKVFDTDNDSKIAISEIGLVIRALGKAPLQKEIEAIEAEAGGDGVVDFAQFMNFYRRKFRRPQDLEKEMREAFRALDATGNGIISSADLRMLLGSLGEPLESEDVESLLRAVSVDAEGNLSYEQLVDMLSGLAK
ncbi:EF hand domain containing protein [Acanthamoeba castellanii str. Neff]|uniref:EF hand domain containing protein n=2 Tax=Acanthamoeba castellanii TaxID=5755 RepID=L8HBJ0_ACACF|nr:EF hand domain containing protein [Acanthamoeba castellanii str. Neff]AFQ89890.1 myosin II light chain 2 [Acanthamoeba castellanii]ELR21771.1 EF hand domain containing protein [Acanthamoeba castellanii str. Neff]